MDDTYKIEKLNQNQQFRNLSSSSPPAPLPLVDPVDITANLLRDLAIAAAISSHQESEEEKHLKTALEEASLDAGVSLPPAVSSAVLLLFAKISGAPEFRLAKWLASARKQSRMFGPSGFPTRKLKATNMFSTVSHDGRSGAVEPIASALPSQCPDSILETTLWERLGKAIPLDIESSKFSWDTLVSLHHTEHTSSTEHSEDEMNKPLEVTVNSGGLVFFALFEIYQGRDGYSEGGVAVMKFSSSRMATQSERLGYEFAKRFGVQTPQARVIHNSSTEWQSIKDATENSRNIASAEGDEMGKTTCTELLEALELSRCMLLMGYVHGFPLLDTAYAFNTQEAAQKTASNLGRMLLLDLVLRNEDRLPCRQLGWRGNSANLLFTEKLSFINVETSLQGKPESVPRRNRGTAVFRKERKFNSVNGLDKTTFVSQSSETSDCIGSAGDISAIVESVEVNKYISDFYVVAIDSGVPRRPPAGKRSSDQLQYPKLVELLLNSTDFSSNLLYEISGEKLGSQAPRETPGITDAYLL
ncbi:hypothetical protein KI387_010904 [Taxus chinensis]|uniref:Actin-fragmin kinase catalytic domain-containing protein n=1 Tax=Taxus chinensis TaxID=29808 RepID=A0AA38KWD1_TAXCH|nr:hypothetical protein KI387_010904 [Taxus chinensis]